MGNDGEKRMGKSQGQRKRSCHVYDHGAAVDEIHEDDRVRLLWNGIDDEACKRYAEQHGAVAGKQHGHVFER